MVECICFVGLSNICILFVLYIYMYTQDSITIDTILQHTLSIVAILNPHGVIGAIFYHIL